MAKNPTVTKIVAQGNGFTELIGYSASPVYPGSAVIGLPGEDAITTPAEGARVPLQIVVGEENFGKRPADVIAAGNNLTVYRPQSGDRVWLRIKAGVAVVKYDELKHDGSNVFDLTDSNDTAINVVAVAASALDADDTVRLVLATIL